MKQFVTVENKTKPNKTNFNGIHNSEITEDFCSVAVSVTSGLPYVGSYKLICFSMLLCYIDMCTNTQTSYIKVYTYQGICHPTSPV